jgi:hypothetical protein
MAHKYLSGRTWYLLMSVNAFTDTYTLVCLTKQGLNRERAVNKQDTQCELSKSFGAVDRVLDLECVTDLTPAALAANVGEASYKLISQWFEAGTVVKIRRKTPTDGSELFQESSGTITKLSDATEVAGNMTFSMTIELTGDFDETA